jgi:hypothetical protein
MLNRALRTVAVAAVAASPALAQEISLKPVLTAGQEMTYLLVMNVGVEQVLGEGGPIETNTMLSMAKARIAVDQVNADGSAAITVRFDDIRVEAPLGDQQMGYQWPATPGGNTAPVAHLGKTLSEATVKAKVDANGFVTVGEGLEGFLDAASKIDVPDQRILGFFTPAGLAQSLTPIFRADDAGKVARTVGMGWQVSETVPLPPAGAIEIVADLTLHESDMATATYGGDIYLTAKHPAEPGDATARFTISEGSGGGTKGIFDRRRNLISYRKHSLVIYTNWQLGDLRMRQTQNSFMTATLQD